MADLLPCPFCGGEAVLEHFEGKLGNWHWSVGCAERSQPDEPLVIECMGYQSLTSFGTKTEAIAAWNRRAPQQAYAPNEGERHMMAPVSPAPKLAPEQVERRKFNYGGSVRYRTFPDGGRMFMDYGGPDRRARLTFTRDGGRTWVHDERKEQRRSGRLPYPTTATPRHLRGPDRRQGGQ